MNIHTVTNSFMLCSCNVPSSIGETFLLLLDKHFPKAHKLSKAFNQNNAKVSYSSMPNFASTINSYNKRILNENIGKSTSASCNCRIMVSSPLDGNWLQSSLAYILAKIINDFPHYIGLTENTFKDSNDDKRIVWSRFSVSANLVCYTFCSMFTDTTSSIVLRCKPSSTTSKSEI